jgi:hypothetical protein
MNEMILKGEIPNGSKVIIETHDKAEDDGRGAKYPARFLRQTLQ